MMRYFVLGLALIASPLAAQDERKDYTHVIARTGNVEFINHHPNCNPFAMAHDPVWVNGWGWTMPRVGWHVMYPTLNYGIARGLMRVGVPRRVAAIGATVGLGLIPHARQAALGLRNGNVYQLNAPDWVFDLWNRSLPSWVLLSSDRTTSRRDVAVWAVGDVVLSCFARP